MRLGKVPKRVAEAIKVRVELLHAAAIANHPVDDETLRWTKTIGHDLAVRLHAVGLMPKREVATLATFLERYIAERGADVKPRTIISLGNVQRNLVAFFGEDKSLRDITPADAHDFRYWLAADQKLAQPTISKRISIARQFFTAARKRRLIEENPFAEVPVGAQTNPAKQQHIERDTVAQIINECPDPKWRLLFALARFAGLRVPSETALLQWDDIDWARKRMKVTSPKTAHHAGGDSRIVPLFPEILPHLEAVSKESAEQKGTVFPRAWSANTNLRTQAQRIIKRAGLIPWPKIFVNLRASCATDLAADFPSHVACKWLGHGERIANRHYRQVVESDYQKAVNSGIKEASERAAKSGAVGLKNVVQKAVQQSAAMACNSLRFELKVVPRRDLLQSATKYYDWMQNQKIAEAGLEPARG